MKKSMKIGTKISIFSCATAVVSAVLMVSVTIAIFMNFVTMLQKNETGTGVKVLEAEINSEVDALTDICRILAAQGDFSTAALDRTWNSNTSEGCYGAYFVGGSAAWKIEGFPFGADITAAKSGGLVRQDGRLLAVTVFNAGEGALVACKDLSDPSFVDSVKEKTGAELTLFRENIRYNTTMINSSGQRNIGTEMSDSIWQDVQAGEVYIGQANVNGLNYYVNYTPMKDINGSVVGAYFAVYSTAEADKELATTIIISALVLAALCAIAAVLLFATMKKLVKQPVAEVVQICGQISSGALDSPDSDFKFAGDEMGEIAEKLTEAKRQLHSIVGGYLPGAFGYVEGRFLGAARNGIYGQL